MVFQANMIDQYCELIIADTGIGIKDSTLKKLFSIKSNGSQKGTDGEKGTGLGLPLCKDFVEKNNGSIHVESTIEQGTTFYIKLPAAEIHKQVTSAQLSI